MKIANNRIFIPMKVVGPTGKSRIVDFWVDSGGGILALSAELARDLELPFPDGAVSRNEKNGETIVRTPQLSLSGLRLDLNGVKVVSNLGSKSKTVFAGIEAEGFLPAKVLMRYDVVFDYPDGTFQLAKTVGITHRGAPLPVSIEAKTGFARIDLAIDSKMYAFMLDTGAAFTGISKRVFSALHSAHPQWEFIEGAVGPANMVGKRFDAQNEVLLLPTVALGPYELRDVAVVSRPAGVYEKYVSQDMSGPIIGALGGNVLRNFRIEVDYKGSTAYLERTAVKTAAPSGCVGIILQTQDDGSVVISGTAKRDGIAALPTVHFGDRLLKINGRSITGLPLSVILSALAGNVGDTRELLLQRNRKLLTVVANVQIYPPCVTTK